MVYEVERLQYLYNNFAHSLMSIQDINLKKFLVSEMNEQLYNILTNPGISKTMKQYLLLLKHEMMPFVNDLTLGETNFILELSIVNYGLKNYMYPADFLWKYPQDLNKQNAVLREQEQIGFKGLKKLDKIMALLKERIELTLRITTQLINREYESNYKYNQGMPLQNIVVQPPKRFVSLIPRFKQPIQRPTTQRPVQTRTNPPLVRQEGVAELFSLFETDPKRQQAEIKYKKENLHDAFHRIDSKIIDRLVN